MILKCRRKDVLKICRRHGTTLRELKKDKKGMGWRGRLTNNMIDKLQNYYCIALRSNSDNLSGMKTATLTSLFHCPSSEDRKLHLQHCPDGANSWCGYTGIKQITQTITNMVLGYPCWFET